MERNVYDNPVRAAEEGNTHTAISQDSYIWMQNENRVKVRLIYRKGDYELRFAGALGIKVPDVNADKAQLSFLISHCRKWIAVNWL